MKQRLFISLLALFTCVFGAVAQTIYPMPINGTINACSGVFTDFGGVDGNYGNHEVREVTICPDTNIVGDVIQLDFTSFSTQQNQDILYIYDGMNVGAPLIGEYSGTESPGIVMPSGENPTGCLTVRFISDGTGTNSGWAANIACVPPCQSINAFLQSSSPTANANGIIRACVGQPITLNGRGEFGLSGVNASYKWVMDDGTVLHGQNVEHSYSQPGIYRVNLFITDPNGCRNANYINQTIHIAPEPTITATLPEEVCFGSTTTFDVNVTYPTITKDCVVPQTGTTFLPDGDDNYYSSYLVVDCYEPTQLIENVNQISRICVNMEHSYSGDFTIRVFAPNGQPVILHNQGGGGTFWGHPVDVDDDLTPGIGETYCFTMNAQTTVINGQTMPGGVIPTNGQMFVPGDYLPVGNFAPFVGSNVNGEWRLEIHDQLHSDNGYVFAWWIEYDDSILPAQFSFTPTVANISTPLINGVTAVNGNQITIEPTTEGELCIPVTILNDFGCEVQTTFCTDIFARIIAGNPNNLSDCVNISGIGEFDLSEVLPEITVDPLYVVTFHDSQEDAVEGTGVLPYAQTQNIDDGARTIYVRIKNINTGCLAYRTFQIIPVQCILALNHLPDLSVCGVAPQTFDLSVYTPIVYNNDASFNVTYHLTEEAALAGTNAIPDAQLDNFNGTNGQEIFVRVAHISDPDVFDTTSFQLWIHPLPNIPATLPVAIACDNGNGAGTFDLNLSTNQITLSPMLTVSYYANEADAELGYVELQLPLSYTSTAGTIYVRVQNATTGCYVVRPLQLSLRALPTAIEIPGLTLCDQGNDGRSVFNLQATAIQIAGNPIPEGVQVTYHETLTDANLNQNAIATPTAYENIVLNNQTVYVRVGYQNSNCASVVPLELNVTPTPELGALSHSLYACDTDNDLIEVFDLTEATSVFLGSLDAGQYTVTYHTTQELALTGSNSIVNPTAFSNATASTIYVRVANNATGCTSVGILNLRINRTPVVPAVVPSYTLCDENGNGFETFDLLSRIPLIIGEQQGLGVTFHYTANDALTGVNPLPTTYQNVVANVQTLYIRVVNQSTGCFSTTTMDIRVEPNPQITLPTEPFSICNIGGTGGFGTIDLVEHILPLVQGTGFAVSYFETQNNAINNIQPIAVPQAYNNLQTTTPVVWIRVTNAYGCFTVYPITFHLETAPAMPVTLPEVNVCDTFGETNDGISIFDLTVQNALIYATNASVDPSELEIKYYTSLANAEQGINWIGNPTQYENTENPQTIWVTVNRVGSKCLRLRSFTIQTRMPLALTTPTTISKCETTLPNVGQEQVDLTIREVQIQGGVQVFGVTFAYYTSAVDRANEVNAIADPTTFVTSTANQTIYIAVTNQYGCVSYTELEVRILPLPEINESPTPLKACVSPDNAPLGIFDLTSKQFEISNDIANLTFRYYTNSDGAYTADPNSLIMNPTQYLAQTGIVYVRVSNNPTIESNSCFVVVPLQLVVLPTVNVPQLSPMYVCIENTNGYHTFNLEDKKSEILGNLPAGDYMVKYYTSEENAINDNAPVPYIYTNIVQTVQEIWVRVYHNEVGCFGIGSFELRVEEEVKAFMPVSTAFCEDDAQNDGNTVMDLTRLNAEIIGTQISTPLSVRYFDAQGNLIADPTSYNGTDGDEITAVVFNTIPGMQCRATVTFTVTTIPGPEVPNIPNGVVCFDFHNPSELIKGYTMDTRLPEGGDYTFQWMDGNGVVVGTGSSYTAVAPGDYTLIVTYLPTGCTSTRTIVVTEGPRITLEEIRFTEDFSELMSMEVIANAGNGVTLEYQLDEGEWQESNVFMNVIPGEHMLRIRVKNGVYCPLEKEVLVMGHPLFFTPNNDGQNDTWNIRALKDQPDSKIYIFDRYGKLLKQISGSGPGWDGTYNGQPMPATDYWFKVIYVDKRTGLEKEATGHFSLIR